jgi:hypothetical protein
MTPYRVIYKRGPYGIKTHASILFARSLELAMQACETRFPGAIVVQAWRMEEAA